MAPSPRSIDLLIQAIRQSLDEAREAGHQFCLATWSDADADAGYLVHVDGRMAGVGEYQYGFSHLDDLASPGDTQEMRTIARHEAGSLAGTLAPIGADDLEELSERLPCAFQADAELAARAVAEGQASVQELFDLLCSAPGQPVLAGNCGNQDKFELLQDVRAARLATGKDGKLAWQEIQVGRAGDIVEGAALAGSYAYLPVPGGFVHLQPEQFKRSPLTRDRPHPRP